MNKDLPKERCYKFDRSIGVKSLFKAFSRLSYNAIECRLEISLVYAAE
jgi:hypothetical protein